MEETGTVTDECFSTWKVCVIRPLLHSSSFLFRFLIQFIKFTASVCKCDQHTLHSSTWKILKVAEREQESQHLKWCLVFSSFEKLRLLSKSSKSWCYLRSRWENIFSPITSFVLTFTFLFVFIVPSSFTLLDFLFPEDFQRTEWNSAWSHGANYHLPEVTFYAETFLLFPACPLDTMLKQHFMLHRPHMISVCVPLILQISQRRTGWFFFPLSRTF